MAARALRRRRCAHSAVILDNCRTASCLPAPQVARFVNHRRRAQCALQAGFAHLANGAPLMTENFRSAGRQLSLQQLSKVVVPWVQRRRRSARAAIVKALSILARITKYELQNIKPKNNELRSRSP